MKELYDKVSAEASKTLTQAYSTSFSLGIRVFSKRYHEPIYNIYGFVRLADEIVDTFHEWDKHALMARFRQDTVSAIEEGISMNPILQSFQRTVNQYNIDWELIDAFLRSMEMDLEDQDYDLQTYKTYIFGSAEVVGLMCLKVFVDGDQDTYERLKPHAMSLGSAFQKINFLRDVRADYLKLGRTYFPGINLEEFSIEEKKQIEKDIEKDFDHAYEGIKQLPRPVRFGVYIAYVYYRALFNKIRKRSPGAVLATRIRIPNYRKYYLLVKSYFSHP